MGDDLIPCHVILPDGKRVPAKCAWLAYKQEYYVIVKTKDAGLNTPSTPEMVLTLEAKYVELDKPDGR